MNRPTEIIEALANQKYFVSDTLISVDLAMALKEEAVVAFREGDFQRAAVGRVLTKRLDTKVRSDATLWWRDSPSSKAKLEYLAVMDELMALLNPCLYLGMRSFEGHFARYDIGAFYKKHIDQHRGVGLRRLSTVLYLSDFESGDGGELVLYDPNDQETVIASITPRFARLALFISEDFPHEVMPVQKPRLSVTGWLRAQ